MIFLRSTFMALAVTGAASAQSPRNLDLSLKPHVASGQVDYIDVTMKLQSVDAKAGAPLLEMQMIAAGVPSARYEASALTVSDAKGALPLVQRDDPTDPANNRYFRHWTTNRAVSGDLTVTYHAPPNPPSQYRGGPVMDARSEDGGINGRGGYFLVLPDDTIPHRVRVHWDLSGMPAGARGVWTHGEGDAAQVLTPDKLGGTIFMAGPVRSYPAEPGGTFNIYWVTEPTWSVAEVAPTLEKLYRYYGQLFDDTTHTMRIFMRRGRGNGGSGAGGSFLMNTPSAGLNLPPQNIPALIAFLAHEMFHQFPETFDDAEVGEPTHWWSEGVATYYANVLAYRLGLKSLDDFAADWNGFIARYYSDPNRLLSYKEMMDGMFGPVGLNIMYGKGQVFMMVLNTRIREKSGGTRSLDDLTFPLIKQHRRGGSYTRADFLRALERELGPQGRAAYEEFRAGGKLYEVPANALGPCFKRESIVHRTLALGFDAAAATTGGRRVVKNLVRGSAAETAGAREGDEIVTLLQLNALRADTASTLTLELRRNGAPVTATFNPRVTLNGFRFVRDPSVPSDSCKI